MLEELLAVVCIFLNQSGRRVVSGEENLVGVEKPFESNQVLKIAVVEFGRAVVQGKEVIVAAGSRATATEVRRERLRKGFVGLSVAVLVV